MRTRTDSCTPRMSGFTLLEILIALFIFTIVAMIMTKALHSTLTAQDTTEAAAEQLAALQTTLLLLSRDLEQAVDRPSSDSEGHLEPALSGNRSMLALTHAGFANPLGSLNSSSLQRTRYRCEQEQLIRDTWDALDLATHTQPHSRVLLTGIRACSFRYLDHKNVFHTLWPPGNDSGPLPPQPNNPLTKALEVLQNALASHLPRAVEINLTLKKGGTVQQIDLLPQEEVGHE